MLELVSPMGADLVTGAASPSDAADRLPPLQRQVLDAVPVARPPTAVSIARTAGLGLEATLAAARARWSSGSTPAGGGPTRAPRPRQSRRV